MLLIGSANYFLVPAAWHSRRHRRGLMPAKTFIRFLTPRRLTTTKIPAKLTAKISVLKIPNPSFTTIFANLKLNGSKRFPKLTRSPSVFRVMTFQSLASRKELTAFSVRFINTASMFWSIFSLIGFSQKTSAVCEIPMTETLFKRFSTKWTKPVTEPFRISTNSSVTVCRKPDTALLSSASERI